MQTLSATPNKDEYNAKTEFILGTYVVTTNTYTKTGRSGSYERGLKFSSNTYGYLTRKLKGTKYYKPTRYSPDHGKTWYESFEEMKKQRAGKVKLDGYSSKEFAFDSIQKINKEYDPSYTWRP